MEEKEKIEELKSGSKTISTVLQGLLKQYNFYMLFSEERDSLIFARAEDMDNEENDDKISVASVSLKEINSYKRQKINLKKENTRG